MPHAASTGQTGRLVCGKLRTSLDDSSAWVEMIGHKSTPRYFFNVMDDSFNETFLTNYVFIS